MVRTAVFIFRLLKQDFELFLKVKRAKHSYLGTSIYTTFASMYFRNYLVKLFELTVNKM